MYYTEDELEYYMQEAYNMGQEDLIEEINEDYYDDEYTSAFDQVMQETSSKRKQEHSDAIRRVLKDREKFYGTFGGTKGDIAPEKIRSRISAYRAYNFNTDRLGNKTSSSFITPDYHHSFDSNMLTRTTTNKGTPRLRIRNTGDVNDGDVLGDRYKCGKLAEFRKSHGIPDAGSKEMREQRRTDQLIRGLKNYESKHRGFKSLGN